MMRSKLQITKEPKRFQKSIKDSTVDFFITLIRAPTCSKAPLIQSDSNIGDGGANFSNLQFPYFCNFELILLLTSNVLLQFNTLN